MKLVLKVKMWQQTRMRQETITRTTTKKKKKAEASAFNNSESQHVLTEKVQLVEKVVKEYEMVLSELEEPVKQEVGREDRNFQIDESKQALKMAKSSPLIKISNDKKDKDKDPRENDRLRHINYHLYY